MFSFSHKGIGLEIADRSIEIVELSKKGNSFAVTNAARIRLPQGIVEQGRIVDEKRLAVAVRKGFTGAKPGSIKPQNVVFGLPESQTYLRTFQTEKQGAKELQAAVQKEAEQAIPLPVKDLVFSWRQITNTKTGVKIVLAATSKEVLFEWRDFFKKATIGISVFDIETLATFRGLFKKYPRNPVCVVDIGSAATQMSVFGKHGLQYAYSVPRAGLAINKEIVKTLGIPEEKAEALKRKVGLTDPEQQVFQVIVKVLGRIGSDIRSVLEYYKESTKQEVQEVVLVGGSSAMKGIDDYFSTNLLVNVRVGKSPWLKRKAPVTYIHSIGLALRGMDEQWDKKDPAFTEDVWKKTETVAKGKQKSKLATKVGSKKVESTYSLSGVLQARSLRRKKLMLGVIAAIGIAAVAGAFWFRDMEKSSQEQQQKTHIVQYTKTQEFTFEIPIGIGDTSGTAGRVPARIIEHSSTGETYNKAVAKSRTETGRQVEEGEQLWQVPINTPQNTEDVEFPVFVEWLVYREDQADSLFLKKIQEQNNKAVAFTVNTIEKLDVRSTENKDVFFLTGRVNVSLNEYIEAVQEQEQQKTQPVENQVAEEQETYVIILETPTGLLNVREGPGVQFESFTEVKPGEMYVLLDEENGWYEIQINNETEGWVSLQFTNSI